MTPLRATERRWLCVSAASWLLVVLGALGSAWSEVRAVERRLQGASAGDRLAPFPVLVAEVGPAPAAAPNAPSRRIEGDGARGAAGCDGACALSAAGDQLALVDEHGLLRMLDARTRALRWSFRARAVARPPTAPLLVPGGCVFAAPSGVVYLLRHEDGAVLWAIRPWRTLPAGEVRLSENRERRSVLVVAGAAAVELSVADGTVRSATFGEVAAR